MQDALVGHAPGAGAVAVGFSPAEDLAPVADHLGWRGRFLADTERRLYGVLGLGRAPWWRVWSPGTLRIYARAARQRAGSGGSRHPARPAGGAGGAGSGSPVTEDTRQMGGDALVRDGVVVARWNPRSPDGRIPAGALARAAAQA